MTDSTAVWLFNQPTYSLRPALLDWLTANHLDPTRIPADADITINEDGHTITTQRTVVDGDGNPIVDRNTVLREPVTVPLLVAPPAEIRHRLRNARQP